MLCSTKVLTDPKNASIPHSYRYNAALMTPDPAQEARLQDLVSRAQNGDTDAFGSLYDHFFEHVYRYAAFRVPSGLAEDITADVFLKAWEKLHTYKARRGIPFSAWLFRIARHTVIDAYRSRQELEEVPEDLEDGDEFNRAEARVKRRHLLRVVRTAMDRLPNRYQEVLELSFLAELPSAEVARVLRMRRGAVRTLKFRALRKLEEALPPEFRDGSL